MGKDIKEWLKDLYTKFESTSFEIVDTMFQDLFQGGFESAQSQFQTLGDNFKRVYSQLMEDNDQVNPSPHEDIKVQEAESSQSQLQAFGTHVHHVNRNAVHPFPQDTEEDSTLADSSLIVLETETNNMKSLVVDDSENRSTIHSSLSNSLESNLDLHSSIGSEKSKEELMDLSTYLEKCCAWNLEELRDNDVPIPGLQNAQVTGDEVKLDESWVIVDSRDLTSSISLESPTNLPSKEKIQSSTSEKNFTGKNDLEMAENLFKSSKSEENAVGKNDLEMVENWYKSLGVKERSSTTLILPKKSNSPDQESHELNHISHW
ncbi:hypothetical protein PanWU01x14_290100 [Parasponia andersonii]|uniref:Uncharacterized protein n=1 Tax=Parasponia andersonii TaxID=3476 RepID=A0A2P5AXU3_PARAD|nr:hypothetical protein PanWU01x14_290100 [Parasponia andersonii]